MPKSRMPLPIPVPFPEPESISSDKPTFNSSVLQRTVTENLKRFRSFQDSLNKISADIQTLEKFLKDCGLNITYTWMTPESDSGRRLGLAWERTENKDFRLTVQKFVLSDGFDGHEWVMDEDSSRQPLISQSSEIRRLLWVHLPKFVELLSRDALGPVEALDHNNSDIPF